METAVEENQKFVFLKNLTNQRFIFCYESIRFSCLLIYKNVILEFEYNFSTAFMKFIFRNFNKYGTKVTKVVPSFP